MRPAPLRRTLVAAAAISVAVGVTGAAPPSTAQATPDDLDCGRSLVEKTLKNGAAWRMCARIHPIKGLVLEKIEFKPATGSREYAGYKRVLDQVYLAQLNVPYDTGQQQYNDITSYGFGGQYLMPQLPELCRGDAVVVDQSTMSNGRLVERSMPGICTDEVDTGLSTHSQERQEANGPRVIQQGTALEVSSVSKISWYEYQQKVTLDDHGSIDVGLGATGDLAAGGPGSTFHSSNPAHGWPIGPSVEGQQEYYATSHWHNAIYRVDFGIDSGSDQRVEQWDHTRTGEAQSPIIAGRGTALKAEVRSVPRPENDALSWWRVLNSASKNRDGHPRSYEIVNRNPTDQYIPVTQPLVSFTNDTACQEYASENLNPTCPNESILDYVANDDAPLTDPVAWVNVGFHHVDRDEDQSPMPIHWQSFQLVPRDFFAQSPTITERRGCINGADEQELDSLNRPCVASNVSRPRITAASTPVLPGTVLTASKGLWNENRTTWNYAFLWFRDGEPIIGVGDDGEPAVGPAYTVTEADAGAKITVKVTASQIGFGSGTAESTPTVVAGGPTPTATVPTGPSPTVSTPATPPRALAASATTGRLVKKKVMITQRARLRVTVSTRGTLPGGRVQIRHGTKVLATGTVRRGKVTVTLPRFKKARTYRLRVVYLGDASTRPSRSSLVTLRVATR